MVNSRSKTADIRQSAEVCMKQGNYTEAFFHWTHAIKLDPDEPRFYFERSKCFLQQQQFYFALQDAEVLIKMNPQNPQGYIRKAEVLFETKNYAEALPTIQKCFTLSPERSDKDHFMEWSRKCKREINKQKTLDTQYPFVGAAVGIVVSTLAVVWDYLAHGNTSIIASPLLKVIIIVVSSFISYWVAKVYRKYTEGFKSTMLEPPIDLFGLDSEDQDLHKD